MCIKHLQQILAHSNCHVSISYYHNYAAMWVKLLVDPSGSVCLLQGVEVKMVEAGEAGD